MNLFYIGKRNTQERVHGSSATLAPMTGTMRLVHHRSPVIVFDVIHNHDIVHSLIRVKQVDNFVQADPLTDATCEEDAVMTAHIGLELLNASVGRNPVFGVSFHELDERVQKA